MIRSCYVDNQHLSSKQMQSVSIWLQSWFLSMETKNNTALESRDGLESVRVVSTQMEDIVVRYGHVERRFVPWRFYLEHF